VDHRGAVNWQPFFVSIKAHIQRFHEAAEKNLKSYQHEGGKAEG
jgi:hypothetical protein